MSQPLTTPGRSAPPPLVVGLSGSSGAQILLLAGSQDHYIPIHQFYDQCTSLTNVCSLTARLFTPYKQAQNHCQVGNYGLALRSIVEWIESLQARDDALARHG